METTKTRIAVIEQVERSLEESAALVNCLKEACEGQGEFRMPQMAIMLAVVLERLDMVGQAMRLISEAS